MIKNIMAIGEGYIISRDKIIDLLHENQELYYELIQDRFFYPLTPYAESPCFFGDIISILDHEGTAIDLDILPQTDSGTTALIAYGYRHYFGPKNEPKFSRYCLTITYDEINSDLIF